MGKTELWQELGGAWAEGDVCDKDQTASQVGGLSTQQMVIRRALVPQVSRFLGPREFDHEGGTFTWLTFHPNAAAMLADDAVANA